MYTAHVNRLPAVFALALSCLLLALPAQQAVAHPLAPTLLQLEVKPGGLVDVTWKTSRLVPAGSPVTPHLPAHCEGRSAPVVDEEPTFAVLRWQVDCGEQGLQGHAISVSGLASSNLNTVVKLIDPVLGTRTWLLKGDDASVRVAAAPSKWTVLADYLKLGVEHLVFGPDHVLLVIALMLLINSTRALLLTVTSFTLGHSVTLSLATLGFVEVPTAPIEVAIAPSTMLVAASIPRESGGPAQAVGRAPWLLAFTFGLLHGFGFAGALADIGLPAGEIPLALFAFNVGIEIGQIAIVLTGWWLLRWWSASTNRGRVAVTYAIGGLAGFWTIQRLLFSVTLPY